MMKNPTKDFERVAEYIAQVYNNFDHSGDVEAKLSAIHNELIALARLYKKPSKKKRNK